jgi:NADH:ubiquinone oxidoreductase subunit H
MTVSTSTSNKTQSYGVQSTGPANIVEIFKFMRLTIIWLSIIFGAVWGACWLFGVVLPACVEGFGLPAEISQTIRYFVPLVAIMVFIPINAMFMVLFERRALALFTVRKGPNRVGPDGLLQTAADAVKLLLKEDITPRGADAFMFTLAPIIFFAPSIFGCIPLLAAATGDHRLFSIANLPTGIFYVLAASSIPVVALVMAGWASNNKYSLVGGLRAAAQAISYEIPLVLSLVTICLLAGSLDVVEIAQQQVGGFLHWNILGAGKLLAVSQASPITFVTAPLLAICCILLFWLYMTGACAEINRIPFDLPEAESELVSGYNTEYSGIKFAIFFLAEFTNLFVVSAIATVMFLGGGESPIPGFLDTGFFVSVMGTLNSLLQPVPALQWLLNSLVDPATLSCVFWAVTKIYLIVFFAILIRGTLPRFRIDQLMDFSWKRLIPLVLILFLAVAYLRELV